MSLSQLELERQARIKANQARLAEIGLVQTVKEIATSQAEARARRKPAARASAAARRAAGALPAGRVRRSERVAGIDAPNYNENARLLSLADGEPSGGRDRRLLKENVSEEIYEVKHLDALGSYIKEWELFVDGYDANGNRIYDKVNGQTCHQCRQKTLGKRTCCAGCQSLQGVLCGDCLYMRYGENVDEVNANPDWLCPLCRDICNCSFHRSRRGWAPTGTLYRRAIAEGYTSVAHYLVLNNLSDAAKPLALERGMCPPELAAELKKEIKAAQEAVAKREAGAAAAFQLAPAQQEQEAAAASMEVAVQEQLLQPDIAPVVPAAEPEGAQARRSARNGSAAVAANAAGKEQAVDGNGEQPAATAGHKKGRGQQKRQGSLIRSAGAVKKVKGAAAGGPKVVKGAAAASGTKAAAATAAAAPQRRGLRSATR